MFIYKDLHLTLSSFVYATNVDVSFASSGTSEGRSLANLTRSFTASMVNCQYFDQCAKMVSRLKLNLVTSRPICNGSCKRITLQKNRFWFCQ